MESGESAEVLDDEFLFYSHLYSAITVLFAMGVLSKFLSNDFSFGFRSFLSLALLFVGEPSCHLLLRGPWGVVVFAIGCVLVYKVLPSRHLPAEGKAILVTGCDTGFGHAIAKKLDEMGATVFAGCLTENGPGAKVLRGSCSDRLHLLQLDVTNDQQMKEALNIVHDKVEHSGGLWGVVNNAGLAYAAELEMTSETILRKILDVNLFGLVRTTRTFLPLVRRAQGRIVNMSSLAGKLGFECYGAYAVSKFGVEAYSDVLRLEMKKWKVNVSTIQPSGFCTASMDPDVLTARCEEIWSTMDPPTRLTYSRAYLDQLYLNYSEEAPHFSKDLSPVVRATCNALFSRDPSAKYPVGLGASSLIRLHGMLPDSLADRLARMCSTTRVTNMRPSELDETK